MYILKTKFTRSVFNLFNHFKLFKRKTCNSVVYESFDYWDLNDNYDYWSTKRNKCVLIDEIKDGYISCKKYGKLKIKSINSVYELFDSDRNNCTLDIRCETDNKYHEICFHTSIKRKLYNKIHFDIKSSMLTLYVSSNNYDFSEEEKIKIMNMMLL